MVASSMFVLLFVAVAMAQELRLVDKDGNTAVSSGRVEVLRDGVWGTVCSPKWGFAEANLVCLDLGFPGASSAAIGGDVEAPAYLPIWKDMVSCTGLENNFDDCSDAYDGDDVFQCGHELDGYATCKALRLASKFGGLGTTEGRVEVYMNGAWGTVCSTGFDANDANMVCRQALSISSRSSKYYGSTIYGEGTGPIHMSGLRCGRAGPDTVPDIFSCPRSDDTSRCSHRDDVGVVCETRVRLVDAGGNPTTSRGRVDLGRGATVCDRLFGQVDGDVVCRQLGFNAGAFAVKPAAFFGQGTGDILVDGSACTEADTDLALCPRFPPNVGYDCGHDRDVGVICRTNVRLVAEDGSVDSNSGRLEVFKDGQWGTVCLGGFAKTAADTVCKLLGFNLGATSSFATPYTPPDGVFTPADVARPIALSGLYCQGNEQNIMSCAYSDGEDIDGRCSIRTNVLLTCDPSPGSAKKEFEFEGAEEELMEQALKEEDKQTLLSRAAELLASLENETAF